MSDELVPKHYQYINQHICTQRQTKRRVIKERRGREVWSERRWLMSAGQWAHASVASDCQGQMQTKKTRESTHRHPSKQISYSWQHPEKAETAFGLCYWQHLTLKPHSVADLKLLTHCVAGFIVYCCISSKQRCSNILGYFIVWEKTAATKKNS